MSELERIKNELLLAGYDLIPIPENKQWTDDDYAQSIGNSVYEVCKLFCEHGHSGFSAGCAIRMLTTLLNGGTLTPLNNNPDEWVQHDKEVDPEQVWQSKRKSSCFSDDNLKTYYDIDEECNKEFELDGNGDKTGWYHLKPRDQWVRHELKEYKKGVQV